MNRLLKKLIDYLFSKTEKLSSTLDSNDNESEDPLQKKINSLKEKRDLMKQAVSEAAKEKDSAQN